jgi:hypothetical protein
MENLANKPLKEYPSCVLINGWLVLEHWLAGLIDSDAGDRVHAIPLNSVPFEPSAKVYE